MWNTIKRAAAPAAPIARDAWSAQTVWWLVGLWLATVGNLPLWQSVWGMGLPATALAMGALVLLLWLALMPLLAWP